ncbi:MAG: NAD(P)/FAD-dependent oxidoreductase, partial [Rhizobiales bacterium]|nr:NAD(P)/FAD-dependent oxidoreductase [Hyphomicrobiales bacterium]
ALQILRPAGIARAISSAGGIARDEMDGDFQLRKLPGCYAVGEMLDWEAPTGGYLLQACFSTAVAAARGLLKTGINLPTDRHIPMALSSP